MFRRSTAFRCFKLSPEDGARRRAWEFIDHEDEAFLVGAKRSKVCIRRPHQSRLTPNCFLFLCAVSYLRNFCSFLKISKQLKLVLHMKNLLPKLRVPSKGSSALAVLAMLILPLWVASPVLAQGSANLGFVTRTIPLPDSDQEYIEHFRSKGWNITLIDDDRVRDNGARAVSGYDLVFISSSIYDLRIDSSLRSAPEPIVASEHRIYAALGMSSSSSGNTGYTTASRKVDIVNPSHSMAAGLNGLVTVATKAKPMNFGKVSSEAVVIATAKDSRALPVIFGYEAGDRMVGGVVAAGARVGFYKSQAHPGFANRDGFALLDAAVAWASSRAPQTVPTPAADTDEIAPNNGTLLGANVSKENYSSRYDAVNGFERQIGRDVDIINRFHEFSAGMQSSFYWDRQHIEDGRTVMVSWRATDNPGSVNGQPDPQRARKISAGQFNAQIDAMAIALRDLEAPVLLRFNWEMDQDIGDPQYIGTPAEFISAWRFVYNRFQARGATNVEWVWAPRARSFAKSVGQSFYPGYDFVDWVGGSAVPINSFEDPQAIYSAWNEWAVNINKPQLLWIGLRENPANSNWKPQFINSLRSLVTSEWTGIKALVYYSSSSPLGYDYTVDTTNSALNAYRNMACNSHFTSQNGC